MDIEEKIKYAIEKTEVLKPPRKLLASFVDTNIHYYILTVPMYLDFEGRSAESETVVREGRITCKKPKLITPSYMLRMEGFSGEARKAFEMLAEEDSDLAMILYGFKIRRDSEKMDIVPRSLESVASRISRDIDQRKEAYSAVIKGVDEFWDVSLSKFVQEMVDNSANDLQVPDLVRDRSISVGSGGFPVITRDSTGTPVIARKEIELLFKLFEKGEIDPMELKAELDRWEVFEQYQDRFFKYFRNKPKK